MFRDACSAEEIPSSSLSNTLSVTKNLKISEPAIPAREVKNAVFKPSSKVDMLVSRFQSLISVKRGKIKIYTSTLTS